MTTDTSGISSQTFYVKVADARLRVKSIAPPAPGSAGSNPVLVFLHEGLGSIELWRDFPESVCAATDCSGLVYDRRGYGGSDAYGGPWPLDYLSIESEVYLPGLLEACGVDKAVLIGHSDGGTIALLFAATRSERACAVITEAAHIFVEEITLRGIRKAVETFETTDLKQKLARYHEHDIESVFFRWADRWLSAEFAAWNIEEHLPRIACPLLVLQGIDDEYGTPAQVEGIASRVSGPVQTRLIPDCGHVPHFQARDAVFDEMIAFIGRILEVGV